MNRPNPSDQLARQPPGLIPGQKGPAPVANLTSKKPDTLDKALEIVRGHVDQAYKRSLQQMVHVSSGVPAVKPQHQQASESNVLEALLSVLEDLDPRYGVTQSKLRSESFERINGERIVVRDRMDIGMYRKSQERKKVVRQ